MARRAVRGLAASKSRSAQRLMSMAQVRAKTMQMTTRTRSKVKLDQGAAVGRARKAARIAKGRAKTEWASLMSAAAERRRASRPGPLDEAEAGSVDIA